MATYKATVFYTAGKTVYNFPFPYLKKEFVKVKYVHPDSSATDLTYNKDYLVDGQTLHLTKAGSTTDTIRIYRETPTNQQVKFVDASILKAYDLNALGVQLLHIAEENGDLIATDCLTVDMSDGSWQGLKRRIKDLLDPRDPQDAVTLHYLEEDDKARVLEMTRLKQSAETAATNSANSASASATSANASKVSEDKAKASETASAVSADLAKKWAMSDMSPDGVEGNKSAKTWANEAKSQATRANSYANQAATSATQAATSASNAKKDVNDAIATADTKIANAASNVIKEAKTYATNAQTSATQAATSAESAKKDVSDAIATADTKIANAASNTIKEARTYASNAQISADNAKASADTAQSTVNDLDTKIAQAVVNTSDKVVEEVKKIKQGADGKSAYEIAVDNGYQGTEEEWLENLKASNTNIVTFENGAQLLSDGGITEEDPNGSNVNLYFYYPPYGDIITLGTIKTNIPTLTNDKYKLIDVYGEAKAPKFTSLPKFNIGDLTTLDTFLSGGLSLQTVDMTPYNTSKITNMHRAFSPTHPVADVAISNIQTLLISNLNTTNVTDMSYMFQGNDLLKTLDVSSFDTSNVVNMSGMFLLSNRFIDSKKPLVYSLLMHLDVSNFDTGKVTNMSEMFRSANGLETLDVSTFNMQNVADISYMFQNTLIKDTHKSLIGYIPSHLKSLNVKNWNTSSLQNMRQCFAGQNALETLDISGWDTSKCTQFAFAFEYCTQLKEIKGVFDVSGATITNKENNITYFTGQNVPFFSNCPNLTEVTLGNASLVARDVTKDDYTLIQFKSVEEAEDYYTKFIQDNNNDIASNNESLNNNPNFRVKLVTYINKRTKDNEYEYDDEYYMINASDNIFKSYYDKNGKIIPNTDIMELTYVPPVIITSNVRQLDSTFYNFTKLDTLNFLDVDTSNVWTFHGCFAGSAFKTLDLSKFNTSKATEMHQMFSGCESLTSLNISNFDTSKVTNMRYMFYECKSLTSLDISGWDTSKVTNMRGMFVFCMKLTNIKGFLDISSISDKSFLQQIVLDTQVTDINFRYGTCKVPKDQITSQLLKGDDTLTIHWVD